MNTENFFLQKDLCININELNIMDISVEEQNTLFLFIEITRYIQELDDLFRVYRCNLNIMNNSYALNNDDTVECKSNYNENNFIVINTLVINLTSSGKIMMESIDNFIKFLTNFMEGYSCDFKKNYLSKTYDKNFCYRFLMLLRNYSQHGHLPVSESLDNRFCFDLNRIINTPHFNIKRSMEDELVRLIDDIYIKYGENPRIMLTMTIVEYNFCIHQLYLEFFNNIEQVFNDILLKMDELIDQKPELIYSTNNELNGNIIFKDGFGDLHCFKYCSSETKKMFTNFKESAQFYFNEVNNELKSIKNKGITFCK